jgi:hypothetical protein
MEQSRLQRRPVALRPQAQFTKFGARADQRRLPEPAAILDELVFNVASGYFNVNTEDNTLTVSTSDYSAGTTVSIPTATDANYTDLLWWVCLPAGKDKMVLAFYFVSDGVKVRTETRSQSTEELPFTTQLDSAALIGQADAEWEDFAYEVTRLDTTFERPFGGPTCFIGPDPGYVSLEVTEFIKLVGTFKTYTPQGVFPGIPQVNIGVEVTSTDFVDSLVAFVVSSKSVTQVDPPEELRSALFSKFRTANDVAVTSRPFITTVENRELVRHLRYATLSTREWRFVNSDNCDTEQFGPTFTAPILEAGVDQGLVYFTNEEETSVSASLTFSSGITSLSNLLRSYGYGFLVNRQDAQTPGWGWTPSVYAFLSRFEAPSSQDTNYQSIRDRYLGNAATSIALTLGYQSAGSQANTSSNHYYFTIPAGSSADFENPVDFNSSALSLSRVTSGARIDPIQSSDPEEANGWQYDVDNPVKAWDWGKPNACIGELMALGFTAEQLGYAGQAAPAGFSFDS